MSLATATIPNKHPMAVRRSTTGEALDYRADLWSMADALRNNMDAAEYKHVVLGLIFLKYISDAFEERHAEVLAQWGAEAAEDRDEYTAENIFWVPPAARWSKLQAQARQPTIGTAVDDAMVAIERENPALRDVLPKDYARPALDKTSLGRVIDLVSNIKVGGAEAQATDVLGSVYEYFLEQFALAEGRKGGEFYTPRSVVRLLVEMLQPYEGRVYDPCCGSSGMFVQSIEFIQAHATGNGNARPGRRSGGGRAATDISIYGQESNYTTWRMARMNLAIRGIEGRIAHGDSFHNDRHPDLRADYILANPPFNVSDWGGERLQDDQRWRYGVPPRGNANFAWVQHFLHHLAPRGRAGFVLANGSMSSNQSGEGQIRKNIVEAGLVDCIVALPGQLFRSTQIPACLWFLSRDKSNTARRNETLFIDARNLGEMIDRTRRDLSPDEITRIANTYHAWRQGESAPSSPLLGERQVRASSAETGEGSSAQPSPEAAPTSRAAALHPLQGERQTPAYPPEFGEGSSAQPPPEAAPTSRAAALHPLQGERQTPAYPPEFGEGSSAQPPPEAAPTSRAAALHPLQGERQTPAYPPEFGEGSSAQPPPEAAPTSRAAALHPLQGERQTPAYPPEFGEGSSAQPPPEAAPTSRAAALHPLQGERQTPAYPPEFGEGSSAQPPPEAAPTSGAAALHPLQGERQVRPYPAETGEGSSAQPPPEAAPTSGAAALHPLQGERQVRPYPAETGEGSSAQPTTGNAKASLAEEGAYTDIPGFCKSATLQEIRKHSHVLTPGRYVGVAPQEDDGEPFEEKMARLTTQWRRQQAEARRLDATIEENLARLGFGAED